MLFNELNNDILLHIWSFLSIKELDEISKTCKRFKWLYDYAYLKNISHDCFKDDIVQFIKWFNKSKYQLQEITLCNATYDPTFLISGYPWPRKVIFDRCQISSTLIDPDAKNTEILIIKNVCRFDTQEKLYINWEKFPNLKVIDIYLSSIDISNIGVCENLEAIRIDVSQKDITLPCSIGKLKKLKFIATTCNADEWSHFDSEKLRICFLPKQKQIFTSNSKLVPESHLSCIYSYVNIQCIEPTDYI